MTRRRATEIADSCLEGRKWMSITVEMLSFQTIEMLLSDQFCEEKLVEKRIENNTN